MLYVSFDIWPIVYNTLNLPAVFQEQKYFVFRQLDRNPEVCEKTELLKNVIFFLNHWKLWGDNQKRRVLDFAVIAALLFFNNNMLPNCIQLIFHCDFQLVPLLFVSGSDRIKNASLVWARLCFPVLITKRKVQDAQRLVKGIQTLRNVMSKT